MQPAGGWGPENQQNTSERMAAGKTVKHKQPCWKGSDQSTKAGCKFERKVSSAAFQPWPRVQLCALHILSTFVGTEVTRNHTLTIVLLFFSKISLTKLHKTHTWLSQSSQFQL